MVCGQLCAKCACVQTQQRRAAAAEAFTNAYYVDIYTGDKAGKATVHDASFTEEKTIDGWASWPLSFDVTVQMTGDTLNLQKVDGYKELYDSYEKGEKITHYGVDSSVDLAEYLISSRPAAIRGR